MLLLNIIFPSPITPLWSWAIFLWISSLLNLLQIRLKYKHKINMICYLETHGWKLKRGNTQNCLPLGSALNLSCVLEGFEWKVEFKSVVIRLLTTSPAKPWTSSSSKKVTDSEIKFAEGCHRNLLLQSSPWNTNYSVELSQLSAAIFQKSFFFTDENGNFLVSLISNPMRWNKNKTWC